MALKADLKRAKDLATKGEYDKVIDGIKYRTTGRVKSLVNRRRARRKLQDIEEVDDPDVQKIADGCQKWLDNSFTPEQERVFPGF